MISFETIVGVIVIWGLWAMFSKSGPVKNYRGPGEIKLVDGVSEGGEIKFKKVMFRGIIGLNRTMDVKVSISLLDLTNGDQNLKPVLSVIDRLQEEDTIAFRLDNKIGQLGEGTYFPDWVDIGRIPQDLLIPPRSGNRKIAVLARFYDSRNPIKIEAGFLADGKPMSFETTFSHLYTEPGYEQHSENSKEAQKLCLKLAVVVAVSDGTLDDSEGLLIKKWIRKQVASVDENKSEKLKSELNASFREAYEELKEDFNSMGEMVKRLAEIGDKKTKYDTIELCLDVMAADGEAASQEMEIIRSMADQLGIKMADLEKMREKVTLEISTDKTSSVGLESLVGLDESWSVEEKRRHLMKEFQKWSNRLNALPEGAERESAQKMLDNIAKLRKQYG